MIFCVILFSINKNTHKALFHKVLQIYNTELLVLLMFILGLHIFYFLLYFYYIIYTTHVSKIIFNIYKLVKNTNNINNTNIVVINPLFMRIPCIFYLLVF